MSSSATHHNQLGKALIEFSSNREFPEEAVSAAVIESAALPIALDGLNQAKSELEVILYFAGRNFTVIMF